MWLVRWLLHTSLRGGIAVLIKCRSRVRCLLDTTCLILNLGVILNILSECIYLFHLNDLCESDCVRNLSLFPRLCVLWLSFRNAKVYLTEYCRCA